MPLWQQYFRPWQAPVLSDLQMIAGSPAKASVAVKPITANERTSIPNKNLMVFLPSRRAGFADSEI
jgi:hypothetical protein